MKKIISYEFNSLVFLTKLASTVMVAGLLLLSSDSSLTSEDNISLASTLTINKTVSDSNPQSGELFLYTLQYSCNSTSDNCEGVVITDPLPPELEFVSLVGSPHTINEVYDPVTHTVTFTFQSILLAGSSGDVQVEVRFPNGTTPDGTVATNTATIDATNASPVVSGSVVSTALSSSKPFFQKYIGAGGAAGGTISYEFEICNTGSSVVQNGTLDFEDISIIDTLPSNTTFLGAINPSGTSHVYDPLSHSLTFTLINNLEPGECIYPKLSLSVPSPPWNVGDQIINDATVYYTPLGESPNSLEISDTTILVAPSYRAGTSKSVSNSELFPGNSGNYNIALEISGTEDLEDYCIIDTIPTGVVIRRIHHGGYFYGGIEGASNTVTISYETNFGGPYIITGSPFSIFESGFIDVYSDLGLPVDNSEYITVINWCYGDVFSGFDMFREIELDFLLQTDAPLGDIVNCTFQNSSTLGVTYQNGCAMFEALPNSSGFRPSLRKQIQNDSGSWEESHSSSLAIGDTATFRLRVRNSSSSLSNLPDPIAADFLPDGLEYIAGSWGFDPGATSAPSPIFSEQVNFNGSGRSLLKWEWTGASSYHMPPNSNIFVTFDAIVNNQVPPGIETLVNNFAILRNTPNFCSGASKETDVDDLDSDGDITEEFCFRDILLNIDPSVSFESEKLVRGQLDSVYTKFPEVAHSVPGGIADYILEVRNLGNVPIDSIVIIDIFPSSGDIGVVDISPRDSRWQPNLVSTVSAPPGVTVFYSLEENPCRAAEGFVGAGPVGCNPPNWSTTPSTDLTNVRSIKFEFGSTMLWPNDTIQLSWAMRAPVNIFSTIGAQPDSIAWNSFGFIGRRTDTGQNTLPSEPLKVGIDIDNVVPNVYGDFVWEDINQDGIQDIGEPGINGIRVELFKDNGDGINNPAVDTLVNFTLTANGGFYLFPNIEDGDYYTVFYKPPAMDITTNDVGIDNQIDSDGLAGIHNGFRVAISPIITLNNFAFDLSWDLGLYTSNNGAVGDYIWFDSNSDGIQNEPNVNGINGVVVELYESTNPSVIIATTTSSNDVNGNPGYYLFDEIVPGNYFIEMKLPSSTIHAPQGATGVSDPLDSDFNTSTSRTEIFAINSGVYDNTWDGGLELSGIEVCDNGIDDDSDGLIDCADSDCGTPTIDDVDFANPNNCPDLNNGSITITASGSNLEFSIDNGTSFQASNIFNGLSDGTYQVVVNNSVTGCSVSHTSDIDLSDPVCVEICDDGFDNDGDGLVDCDDPDCGTPTITDVTFTDPDNCPALDNGTITITATGSNLEFSIDNGTSFQASNIFNGLSDGTYQVVVNNSVTGCSVNHTSDIDLSDPVCVEICDDGFDNDGDGLVDCDDPDCGIPTIDDVTFTDPDNCPALDNGTITITATGFNLEYSIDNGVSFQASNIFNGLSDGTYQVVVNNSVTGCSVSHTSDIDLTDLICVEICDDGFDNDGDGLVDCDDSDCVPEALIVSSLSTACVNEGITFSTLDVGIGASYSWVFGADSNPSTSIGRGDHLVSYSTCGAKEIIVEVMLNGCMASDTINVTINDITNPSITLPAQDTIAQCNGLGNSTDLTNWLNNNGGANATDDCGEISWSFSLGVLTDDCGLGSTQNVIFIATDNCGNISTSDANFIIADTTPPNIGTPAVNEAVDCDSAGNVLDYQAWLTNNGGAAATDICGTVSWSYTEDAVSNMCGETSITTVTFTAVDQCNNTSQTTATFTIEDNDAPVMTDLPLDVTVNCESIPAASLPTINDDCDSTASISSIDNTVAGSCPQTYVIERTFTALDACGNSDIYLQTITVEDTTKPILANVPLDITVECSSLPVLGDPVTATDNCDSNVGIVLTTNTINGDCVDRYIIERTWIATDACGNSTSAIQTVEVEDNTSPVMSGVPADITITCGGLPPTAASVLTTDNCDPAVVVNFAETSTAIGTIDCSMSYTITRTWEAIDRCGNSSNAEQIITVEGDDEAPVLASVPLDITVECSSLPEMNTSVTVTDNCASDPTIQFTESIVAGDCADRFMIVREWVAEDDCGNTSIGVQEIEVVDTTLPVMIGVPVDITITCGGVPPTAASVLATDNCDPAVIVNFGETSTASGTVDCSISYTITRTWEAIDRCGNSITSEQIITVEGDDEAPIMANVPLDVTVECSSLPEVNDSITATDNCASNPTIQFTESIVSGDCADRYTIVREWIAEDDCGNTSIGVQEIVVEDNTPPSIANIPADLTILCGEAPPVRPSNITAIDNCDTDVIISFMENNTSSLVDCTVSYVLTRTWEATDRCGNVASLEQSITVEGDNQAPILSNVPPDLTFECGSIPELGNPVTADDNCDPNVQLLLTEETIAGACPQAFTRVRTWTATDACGNQVSASQNIIVQDSSPPFALNAPGDLSIDCGQSVPAVGEILVVDNCDPNPQISFNETSTLGNFDCADSFVIERIWTLEDACGNATIVVQTISVNGDAAPPVLENVPSDITFECDNVPALTDPVTAMDDCRSDVSIEFIENTIASACPQNYIIERTWIATDVCGNSATATQNITVEDTTAPSIVGVPVDISVDCTNITAADSLTVSDNCDDNINLFFTEEIIEGDCTQSYTLIRNWNATDACGNNTSLSQQIFVTDSIPPTISEVPVDITVDLFAGDTIPEPANPTVFDMCDSAPSLTFTEDNSGGCAFTITRTWTASDACGNTAITQQVIAVENQVDAEVSLVQDEVCDEENGTVVLEPSSYGYLWPDSIITSTRDDLHSGTYLITVTDLDSCTAVLEVVIGREACPDCTTGLGLFDTDRDILWTRNCNELTTFCLDIPFETRDSFHYFSNGIPFGSTVGCQYDSLFSYSYFSIPGLGMEGPYSIDRWVVDDEIFSGEVEDIFELVEKMNAWNPSGNWWLDENNLIIIGGNSNNVYGDMLIIKMSTRETGQLNLNAKFLPNFVGLDLTLGDHLIFIEHIETGCSDSINISVLCEEIITNPDTISIDLELGRDTIICFDASELSSDIDSVAIYCDDISTGVVSYTVDDNCILIQSEFLGEDITCISYCDDQQVCDTLVIMTNIFEEIIVEAPIALNDDTTSVINVEVINFDIVENDTFNILTDSFMIVNGPLYGTARINDSLSIDYIPDEDVCGVIDSFVYVIVGPSGSSMATVFIEILCDDLTIFNGFSPNGDDVNDIFVITGIEAYPNNTLTIFNRWGNQIYFQRGYTNSNGWKGTWEGRPLPDGTYFYVLDDGRGKIYSGYVQIHR